MTDLYIKVRGKFHVARKTYPGTYDSCSKCSLKRVCKGKSIINSGVVNSGCSAYGYGWKLLKRNPLPEPKKSFWETCETKHPQIIVEGMDPRHGKFRIPCDVAIAPLVIVLNMMGVRTLYSCQGDPKDDLSAYVCIDGRDETKTAVRAILEFWKGYAVYRSAFPEGSVSFYMAESVLPCNPRINRRRKSKAEAILDSEMTYVNPSDYGAEE